MANQTNLNVRTDAELKKAAEQIFEQLGLNMSTAVNIFLHQVIRQGGLPFEVKLDVPNEVTTAVSEGKTSVTDKNSDGYGNAENIRAVSEI